MRIEESFFSWKLKWSDQYNEWYVGWLPPISHPADKLPIVIERDSGYSTDSLSKMRFNRQRRIWNRIEHG
jgi:hypothetical protein